MCQEDWRASAYSGLSRETGIIDNFPPGKGYGWIKTDEGESIFFAQLDIADSNCQQGNRVTFVLAPSWDRKKQRMSNKAVEIQPA